MSYMCSALVAFTMCTIDIGSVQSLLLLIGPDLKRMHQKRE